MREKKDLTSNCVVLINHHPIKRALNDMEGLFLLFFFMVVITTILGVELRLLHLIGRYFTLELHLQPLFPLFKLLRK
jgi:hypothetical protein